MLRIEGQETRLTVHEHDDDDDDGDDKTYVYIFPDCIFVCVFP